MFDTNFAHVLAGPNAHKTRYTSVISIRSSIMKTRPRYRQADINGPMGKATWPNSLKGKQTAMFGPRASVGPIVSGQA